MAEFERKTWSQLQTIAIPIIASGSEQRESKE
jgi:hypothetical protein